MDAARRERWASDEGSIRPTRPPDSSAASLLLVLAVALTGVAVYAYLRGAYSTAIPVGVAAALTNVFVLLTRK